MGSDADLDFSPAGLDDLPIVLAILDEAAAWLWERNIRQWPRSFEPEWVVPAIERREVWVARSGGEPIGTFSLSWQDAAWSDSPEPAGYVHRLSVRRGAAGTGARLLVEVERMVAENGRALVRLDCVAANPVLCDYYERAGFLHRGDVDIHGAPGQRLVDGGSLVTISRYERSIGPRA